MRELLQKRKNELKVEKERFNLLKIIVLDQQILFERNRGNCHITTDKNGMLEMEMETMLDFYPRYQYGEKLLINKLRIVYCIIICML